MHVHGMVFVYLVCVVWCGVCRPSSFSGSFSSAFFFATSSFIFEFSLGQWCFRYNSRSTKSSRPAASSITELQHTATEKHALSLFSNSSPTPVPSIRTDQNSPTLKHDDNNDNDNTVEEASSLLLLCGPGGGGGGGVPASKQQHSVWTMT